MKLSRWIIPFVSIFGLLCLPAAALLAQEAVPNYYTMGNGITFSGKDGHAMTIRGYLQPFAEMKDYTEEGNDALLVRYRMRRARLRIQGEALQSRLEYRVQFDLSGTPEVEDGNSLFLLDAFVTYNITRRIDVTFGQRSSPADVRLLNSHTLMLPERSRVVSAFSTIREFGIFSSGRFAVGGGQYLRPYLTITTGDGGNVLTRDRGGIKLGGRLDYLPFGLFTNQGQFAEVDMVRERSPKLVLGLVYSVNYGMSSRRGRESGTILYLDANSNESLPNYYKFGVDLLFKYKGLSVLADYVYANGTVPDDIVYRVRNDGSIANTFLVDGVQDVENYVKGRMMLGHGFHLQAGYLFKSGLSVAGRYTHLIPLEHSFLNNGTFYNRPNYYTLGVGQFLSRNYGFQVQGSVTYVELDAGSNDIYSQPITGNEWIYRIMTTIAF